MMIIFKLFNEYLIVCGVGKNVHLEHIKRLELILANSDFHCLLITFANSLGPDQDQQNVSPDLDPNRLML